MCLPPFSCFEFVLHPSRCFVFCFFFYHRRPLSTLLDQRGAGTRRPPHKHTSPRPNVHSRAPKIVYSDARGFKRKSRGPTETKTVCVPRSRFIAFFLFKSSIHPVLFTFGTAVVISLFPARFSLFGRDSLSWYQIGVLRPTFLLPGMPSVAVFHDSDVSALAVFAPLFYLLFTHPHSSR